jgi:hypothetical protein
MGVSKDTPSAWMLNDGTGKSTIYKGPGGWYRKHADGRVELIQSMNMGAVDTPPTNPRIAQVTNPADGTYYVSDGAVLTWKVRFDEGVSITGTPIISFTIGGTSVKADYDEKNSDEVNIVFTYTTQTGVVGDVADVGGTLKAIDVNGGTIKAIDNDDDAVLTFPSDWNPPVITIAESATESTKAPEAPKKPAKKAPAKKA